MNEKYELRGRVRTLEQRKPLKFPADSLANTPDYFNNFDIQFSVESRILRKTAYTFGGAKHTVKTFLYDAAGNLIETADFDAAGMPIATSTLEYQKERCTWARRDSSGIIIARGVDEYEADNLVLARSFDNQDRLRTKKIVQYREGKLAHAESLYYLPDGNVCERSLTDFDSEGQVLRTFGLKADGSPLGDGKYMYEYNREGRRAKVWTFNEFADDELATMVRIYDYIDDELGNWIQRHETCAWRNDSYQSRSTTTRKLEYYP